MKNTDRIDKQIIDDVRENLGIERGDTSKDDEINNMSPNEILDRWCEWNGFINGSEKFRRVMGSIYSVNLDSSSHKNEYKDALLIAEEILRIIDSPDNLFSENMHEYICERLDISDKSLKDALNIISNIRERSIDR